MGKTNDSSSKNIGMIIGIVAGGVVAIAGGVAAWLLIKKKILTQSQNIAGESSCQNIISETEPKKTEDNILKQNENNPIVTQNITPVNFHFITTGQNEVNLKIDSNMTVSEVIQSYFHEIKRPDLYKDPNIRFLMNANVLYHDSKEPINQFIKKINAPYNVVIDDLDDKIQ